MTQIDADMAANNPHDSSCRNVAQISGKKLRGVHGDVFWKGVGYSKRTHAERKPELM